MAGKFLPILGKYVIQMLEGTLDAELAKVWAWDRDNGPSPNTVMWPRRERRCIASTTLKTAVLQNNNDTGMPP